MSPGETKYPKELLKLTDQELVEAVKNAERHACKTDLYFLAKEVLGYKDLVDDFHRPLCAIIASVNPILSGMYSKSNSDFSRFKLNKPKSTQRFEPFLEWDDYSKVRLFLMFRGSFKTTLVSIAHTIQLMLINPDIRILIASHKKEGGSQEILGAIRQHFTQNKRFRDLFPEYCPKPNSVGTIDWGTSERVTLPNRSKDAIFPEETIEISGMTTDNTGRHYDYIKADDLVTKDSVTNETMLEKTEQYNSLIKFLFNQPEWGILDYSGTPYHFADLYASLREQKDITKVIVPITKDEEPTFPERFTKEGIERIKNDSAMTSYVFSCQYLLNPIPTDEQVFRPEWFTDDFYYQNLPINLRHYIFVDPANKQRKKSDYTALIHLGFDSNNHIYIIDLVRDKLSDADRVRLVFDYCKKYNLHQIHYESIGFQSTDAYNIRRHGIEIKYPISVEEIKGSHASKEDRIRGLQFIFESKAIHFPKLYYYNSKFLNRSVEMVETFKKEAFMFPKCEHDDMLDCLSFCLDVWTMPANVKKTDLNTMDEFMRVRQLAIDSKKPKYGPAYPRRKNPYFQVPHVNSFR